MGVVYKALDTKLNRHVAIKFLPTELTADAERRMRFEREAQATAALSHPNIAVIHEVGEYEGTLFIVMEYVEGRGLGEVLRNVSLSTTEWIAMAPCPSPRHCATRTSAGSCIATSSPTTCWSPTMVRSRFSILVWPS